jgi:hypothetical protein
VQWASFVAGTAALVLGFAAAHWGVVAGAASVLAASGALLCANLWPLLRRAPRRGVAEVGIVIATTFFVSAAVLGAVLAANRYWPLLDGAAMRNLAAHAHLAAIGWVGVTIVSLSFRFRPAFLLPEVDVTEPARRLVLALAASLVALVVALLVESRLAAVAALATTAAMAAFVVLCARVIATRRMPIDWTARHAVASLAWCALVTATGAGLALAGAADALGVRLAAAYGLAALLGWISNLVVGVSYKLFPGFVAGARVALGRVPVPMATLAVPPPVQPVVFVLWNAGIAGAVAGAVLGSLMPLQGGLAIAALAAIVYATASLRTLAFAARDPRRPPGPLAVLP